MLTNTGVPANGDVVVILNGYTVNLTANVATTGHSITIQKGGVLDMQTFSFGSAITKLEGQGLLRLASTNFPAVTTNNFDDAGTGTVEFYDLGTITLPSVTQYNNLLFSNSKATAMTASVATGTTVLGTLTTKKSGVGALTLALGANTLSIAGDMTLAAGTTLSGSGAITTSGNITNNGSINSTGSITFTGTTNRSLEANGATKFNNIIVNKGAGQQYILSITAAVAGNFQLNEAYSGYIVDLQNGTLKLGQNITLSRLMGDTNGQGGYELPATAGLWIDGASVTLPGNTGGSNKGISGGLIARGLFRISSGSFTSLGNDGAVIGDVGSYLIEGGTVTVEKFSPRKEGTPVGSFTMTGGTFNVRGTGAQLDKQKTYARFAIPFATQTFSMSGGIINVYNAEGNDGVDIATAVGNYSVTGGDFNIILPPAADAYPGTVNINSVAPFWNMTISEPTAAAGTTGAALMAPITVLNNLTLTSGANQATLQTNSNNVTVQGNFIVGAQAVYLPGTNITSFTGSKDQNLQIDGTIGITGALGLNEMLMNKSNGTLTLAGSSTTSMRVRSTLTLTSGVFNDAGKVLTVLGNVVNSATHTSSGTTTGSITLAGTTHQTIGGDGSGIFGNLVLNNSLSTADATYGPKAVEATADQTVSGTLTLANDRLFDIGTHRLYITSVSKDAIVASGGSFSNARMILTAGNQSDGGIRKTYGSLETFIFPVGTQVSGTYYYTPAAINLMAAPARYGKINVAPVKVVNPFSTDKPNSLQYFWKVSESDFAGLAANKVVHKYTASNALIGGNKAFYVAAYYDPATVTWKTNNLATDVVKNAATIDINFSAVNINGEYTAGDYRTAFGTINKFYSRKNGNWNVADTWSRTGYDGVAATDVPGAGNPVFIGNNYTVTVTANGASSGSLQIDKGATLDLGTTTGHNFGSLPEEIVQGSGTLRIASTVSPAVFPGGDFANFLGPQGGTVEYYTVGAFAYTLPANTVSSYYNLVLNAGTSRTLTLPNQNLHIYNDLSTGTQTGFNGLVSLSAGANGDLTIDGNVQVQNGQLRYGAATRNVTVGNNVLVSTGATFGIITGTVLNTLQIGGSVINNGTLALAPAGGKIDVTFVGDTDQKITGTGTATSINKLTVNKGTSRTPVLTLDVAGTLSVPATDNWLVLTNGTFSFAKPSSTILVNAGTYTIGNTAGLSVNGAGAVINLATGATLQLDGRLSALAGTINVGRSIEYSGATQPEIVVTSGTLNVDGQIRRPLTTTQGALTYSQSGGNVLVRGNNFDASRAQFEVLNAGSSFTMTGGALTVLRTLGVAATADVYLHPATSTVTGGEIVLGNPTATAAANLKLDTTVPLFSLKVDNGASTANNNTATLLQNPLTLKGNLTIGNANSIFNTDGLDVSIAGNFTNGNTTATTGLTVGGYQAKLATQTTTLNASTNNQLLTGATGNLTNFGNLVINNTNTSGQVNLQTNNTALRVHGQLTLTKGELADGGNTISVLGNVVNSAKHSGAGKVALIGAVAQTIGGDGYGIFGNLEINNGGNGATALAAQQVDGILTLTNGNLTIGSNLLKLTNTSSTAVAGGTFSTTKMIITNGNVADEGVQKSFPAAATSFVFPVGVTGKYTPATYTVNANTAVGTITVAPVNSAHPSNTDAASNTELKYYWRVGSTGFSGLSVRHVYQYVSTDATAAQEANYRTGRFLINQWIPIGGIATSVDAATHTINLASTTANTYVSYINGDYTAGLTSEFQAVKVYYSRNAAPNITTTGADWDTPSSWTFNPDGSDSPAGQTATTAPAAGTPVVILPGHVINTSQAGRNASSLTLSGTLNIGNFTSNNFGVVTGTGRLIINSSTFPAGNYTDFTSTAGGTVEYTGFIVTLPPRSIYNNLVFSGINTTKSLGNVSLQVNGSVLVNATTTINNESDIDVTLVNPAKGFVNNGTFNLGNGALSIAESLTNNTGATLTLGGGKTTVGTSLMNAGTITTAAGDVVIGTVLVNSGSYQTGAGALKVASHLTNSGTFNAAGQNGVITVGGNLATSNLFSAGNGDLTVTGNLVNSGIYNANANKLTLTGDFTNQSTFNAGSSNVYLQGNWTNSGVFTAGTSAVRFLSNTARNLGGTLATTFYNVYKEGTGALTMQQSATVSNLLNLNQGNIVTGANTLHLTNTATQPVTGESLNAYILGKLAITFPTEAGATRTFPVGNFKPGDASINFYRPVTIVAQGGSTAGTEVQVEMVQTSATGAVAAGSGISNLSRVRYYSITALSGAITNPTVQLSFNTNINDEEINVPSNLRVARATAAGGTWTNEGGAGVFSPAAPAGYVTSGVTSITNNSLFALASTNLVDNPLNNAYTPLPVELVAFTAKMVGTKVQLAWATSMERNSSHFVVERSLDGRAFEAVAQVAAQGTSTTRVEYAATDARPFQGQSYYRLRQVDNDGRTAYSSVVVVKMAGIAKAALQAYPNPAKGTQFNVLIQGLKGTAGTLRITDGFGREVYRMAVNLTLDQQDMAVKPAAKLAAGMYIVSLQTAEGRLTQKLVVE
ncbi:T9SS type A sorting domain-containing protein [Hymenobacter sp. BT730]|uniref:T9SS type A sorting domain-containing protein n=1 Tax=Hymenobacter sp. BT730 TaxID=3063332 RepID=UPI0026E0A8EF|nr:T9SS type A sorting domain-containing protein [Hymenobacter sp. BT730]